MSDYINFLQEVFSGLGTINARRMFGGHGLYCEGCMFALVADDVVYLKADSENSHYFEDINLEKFFYEKNGKSMALSYYHAPDEVFDNFELATEWARRSWEAAARAKQIKLQRLQNKATKK